MQNNTREIVSPLEPLFNLHLANIPIINVQQELHHYCTLLQDPEFRKKLSNQREPIDIGYLVWRGLPKNLLTHFLQRGIFAVEACIDAAVEYEATAHGRFDDEFRRLRGEVWSGWAASAHVLYNRLPGLLSRKYKLCNADAALWMTVKRFYQDVRNPLFHGMQLYRPEPEAVLQARLFLAKLMSWIDSWCSWQGRKS